MSQTTLVRHEKRTKELSDSPKAVKYVEDYYASGRGRTLSKEEVDKKIDKMGKHFPKMLKTHLKEGVELRREEYSRVREESFITKTGITITRIRSLVTGRFVRRLS